MEPKIVIKTNGIQAEIYVNGKKLEGVRGYSFVHNAQEPPQLQILLKAVDVTVETTLVPELPEIFKPFYVSKDKLIASGILTEEQ